MTETERQAHNERVRYQARTRAIHDRLADGEWLARFDRVIERLPWWAWRRRRFYTEGRRKIRADRPGWCPACGCEHRPSAGCPQDFIPATPLGIITEPQERLVRDAVRDGIRDHLASRRADPEFQERLRRRIEQDRPILDRLRDQDGSTS